MKYITLTQGQRTIVDNEDFSTLNKFKWHFNVYATRTPRDAERDLKKAKNWRMHWEIVGKPAKGLEVDHINRNKLDNRRRNLRIVTKSQNVRNRGKTSVNKSGFKGVSWQSVFKKWRATIVVNKKQLHLGYFNTPAKAHKAYCKANIKYYGKYGSTN